MLQNDGIQGTRGPATPTVEMTAEIFQTATNNELGPIANWCGRSPEGQRSECKTGTIAWDEIVPEGEHKVTQL